MTTQLPYAVTAAACVLRLRTLFAGFVQSASDCPSDRHCAYGGHNVCDPRSEWSAEGGGVSSIRSLNVLDGIGFYKKLKGPAETAGPFPFLYVSDDIFRLLFCRFLV